MLQRSRLAELWLIAAVFGVVSVTLWGLGRALDEPLLSFTGLMTLASTFVPMPADAYVVNASQHIDPVSIGILGGAVNAVSVLGERLFLDRLVEYPFFERLKTFVGTNRFVEAAERHMFLGLIIAAASPLPFEVFRFVACARDYPRPRYALATFIGRGSRYYVLALGSSMFASESQIRWIVIVLIALFVAGVLQSIVKLRRKDA